MNQEELEFVTAIEDYKIREDKLFLSWCEVLAIVKNLGYTRQTSYDIYETRAREIIEQMKTDPDLMDNWHQDSVLGVKVKVKVREILEGRE